MEIIENKSTVWDSIWKKNRSVDLKLIKDNLVNTKKSKTWVFYTKLVNERFGGWKNVNSVEIGSGMGWYSFVAATEGANVTLIDYSEPALALAKKRFDLFSINADYIYGNAFDLIKNNDKKYNLSWSFGTAEHFKNDLRQEFFKLHFDYVNANSLVIISCPYGYALNYRLWMYYANRYKEWSFGLEIPYTKTEYLKRLKLTRNRLVTVFYEEGRPCLNKMMNVLKNHSKTRYFFFYPWVRLIHKFNLKLPPFNYRSIILVAEKVK